MWQVMNATGELLEQYANSKTAVKKMAGFAEFRDYWAKLDQFFQIASNIIEVCLKESVERLLDENQDVCTNRRVNTFYGMMHTAYGIGNVFTGCVYSCPDEGGAC